MARTYPRYAQLAIRRHASLWLPVPGPAFMVSASVLSPGCRRLLELSFLSLIQAGNPAGRMFFSQLDRQFAASTSDVQQCTGGFQVTSDQLVDLFLKIIARR
jgi:hypothetical protein